MHNFIMLLEYLKKKHFGWNRDLKPIFFEDILKISVETINVYWLLFPTIQRFTKDGTKFAIKCQ